MLKKRSFTIARHRTSVALEPQFWAVLEEIAGARGLSLARLVAESDAAEQPGGLASALRLHSLAAALDAGGTKKNGPRGAKPRRPKSGESL
ncbi:MAG: ribbon-helix-helix domain-containing protein [Alphaproteobacteria bacterium]